MKISQKIKKYEGNSNEVILETEYDDIVTLRVSLQELSFNTKVSKELLLEFLKALETQKNS